MRCGLNSLNGDKRRLVVAISAHAMERSEDGDGGPQEEAPAASGWGLQWVWGPSKGGLCTQALLACVRGSRVQWRGKTLGWLHQAMHGALARAGHDAVVTVRSSRDVEDLPLGELWGRLPHSQGQGVRRALLVGVRYAGQLQLEGSWNDVEDLKAWLSEDPVDLRILTDAGSSLPTRKNILAQLRWLLSPCTGLDQLLLHFSGHGDDAELLPCDWQQAGPISGQEISELVEDLLPEGATLTCVFDCCDSSLLLRSLRHQLQS
ncbi:unnamed protein product [Effrenium voratum]|nr:unnamed protein product [Effrenium voratum]